MAQKKTMSRDDEELSEFIRKYALYSPAQKKKDQAWATKRLGQMKSYDDWVAGLYEEQRASIERLSGSLSAFYDGFINELKRIQLHGNPTTFVFKQLERSELGRKGGAASAKKLTPEDRTKRAHEAGKARQAKARRAKGGVR